MPNKKRPIDSNKLEQMEQDARNIGRMLEKVIDLHGEHRGFALMIFSFDGPEFTWISNANRADMVRAMQEFIDRNPPDKEAN